MTISGAPIKITFDRYPSAPLKHTRHPQSSIRVRAEAEMPISIVDDARISSGAFEQTAKLPLHAAMFKFGRGHFE